MGEHPAYSWIDEKLVERTPRTNENENTVYSGSFHASRYPFDFEHCSSKDGWRQFDTEQDAAYFGVWVHMVERLTFTYAEGDIYLVTCDSAESFKAELRHMTEFYGEPPPAFIAYDLGAKTRTEIYDIRPSAEEVS